MDRSRSAIPGSWSNGRAGPDEIQHSAQMAVGSKMAEIEPLNGEPAIDTNFPAVPDWRQ